MRRADRRRSRPGALVGHALALAATLAALWVGLDHLAAGLPVPSLRHVDLRTLLTSAPFGHESPRLDLDGTRVAAGSIVVLWGGGLTGYDGRVVRLEASLGGKPWRSLATTDVQLGRWQLDAAYPGPGRLRLRLLYPNGDRATGTVTVVRGTPEA